MDPKKLTYQFKVSLKEIEPTIWRRIEVPAIYSFWNLHVAIQDAMGWLDYHLHVFYVPNPETGVIAEIGIPDDEPFEDDLVSLPGWEIPLTEYFIKPGDRADYEYDFGDGWEHEIVLEKIQSRVPKAKYPRCLDGARACPPEDCGGIGGYESMLEVISDPSHEEYESTMTWLGRRYDPESFDPKKVKFDNPKKRWRIAFMDEKE
jgi:hypothetical protein